jgi:hypothetical protein
LETLRQFVGPLRHMARIREANWSPKVTFLVEAHRAPLDLIRRVHTRTDVDQPDRRRKRSAFGSGALAHAIKKGGADMLERKHVITLGVVAAVAMSAAPGWAFPVATLSKSSPVIQVAQKRGESEAQYKQRCWVSKDAVRGFGYYKC